MYLVKSPWWFRVFNPGCVWRMPTDGEKIVYLTFDDGPTPEVTERVLELLDEYNFGATFFLIGNNIDRHPDVFKMLQKSRHSLGNHTYNHPNGWKTPTGAYLENFEKCDRLLDTQLFRPPYGRIKKPQARQIALSHKIIMWDVISGDFDDSIDGESCIRNVIPNIRPGSIIVFHDSEKAWPRLKVALPKVLEFLKENGYRSEAL